MGQETDLPPGTNLHRQAYRARSAESEHAHCVFCFAKFMDPDFSEAHRRVVEQDPEVLTQGHTTTADHAGGAGSVWVCPRCVEDFAGEFGWRVTSD
jgi:hypothetical protein